jgi:hypothetical protein
VGFSLQESGKKAECSNGGSTAAGNVDGASGIAAVVGGSCSLRGAGTRGLGSLSGSAGRGTRGGCALVVLVFEGFLDLLDRGRFVLQAISVNVVVASFLDVKVASAAGDALAVKFAADVEGDRLRVEFETGSRVVGSASTIVLESRLNASVLRCLEVAENSAGVRLALAPSSSLQGIDSAGIRKLHVKGAGVVLSLARDGGGNGRNGESSGSGTHFGEAIR